MAGQINHSSFDKALDQFKEGLGRREIEDFKTTTLKDLKINIGNLQAKQHAQRRLRDFSRLQLFLEAIEQYRDVVDKLYSNNDIIAFIWVSVFEVMLYCFTEAYRSQGPIKFLLQV